MGDTIVCATAKSDAIARNSTVPFHSSQCRHGIRRKMMSFFLVFNSRIDRQRRHRWRQLATAAPSHAQPWPRTTILIAFDAMFTEPLRRDTHSFVINFSCNNYAFYICTFQLSSVSRSQQFEFTEFCCFIYFIRISLFVLCFQIRIAWFAYFLPFSVHFDDIGSVLKMANYLSCTHTHTSHDRGKKTQHFWFINQ